MSNTVEAQRVVKALPGILRGGYHPREGTDPLFVEHILTGADDDPTVLSVLGSISQVALGRDN